MAINKVHSYRLSYDIGTGGYVALRVYTAPGSVSNWSNWIQIPATEFSAVAAILQLSNVEFDDQKNQFTSAVAQVNQIV